MDCWVYFVISRDSLKTMRNISIFFFSPTAGNMSSWFTKNLSSNSSSEYDETSAVCSSNLIVKTVSFECEGRVNWNKFPDWCLFSWRVTAGILKELAREQSFWFFKVLCAQNKRWKVYLPFQFPRNLLIKFKALKPRSFNFVASIRSTAARSTATFLSWSPSGNLLWCL